MTRIARSLVSVHVISHAFPRLKTSTDKGHLFFSLRIETDLHGHTVQSASHRRHACLFGHIHPRTVVGHYTRHFYTSTVPPLPGAARNRPAQPILEDVSR